MQTETICSTNQICFSYVQVRGSVPRKQIVDLSKPTEDLPVFWEQQGFQTFNQRIQITRPQAAAQPAFEKHFTELLDQYGAVHIVNLLGSKENETTLSTAYAQLASKGIGGENITMTNFDFHNAVRVGGHDSVPSQLKYVWLSARSRNSS